PELAWRAMFWIGILPALVVIWVRRHVPEPEIYIRHRETNDDSAGKFLQIFSPAMLRTTLLASVVALGAQGGYYAVNTFLPLYLNSRGLGIIGTGAYLIVIVAGSFGGYLISDHLADALGRRAALLLFAAGSFLAIGAYTVLPLGDRA